MNVPPVSVVIATYSRGRLLIDSIESLRRNEYPQFEIIVVDQTPSHPAPIADKLHELQSYNAITYLTMETASIPLARNVGIRQSSGDIIVFCDDDIRTESSFIASHVAPYRDSSIGAVGGRIITPHHQREEQEKYAVKQLPGRILPNGELEPNFDHSERCDIDWGMGCNMSFRRKALVEAGGFDERYTEVAFCEEVDAFVRVRRLGYRAVFEPTAILTHLHSPKGGTRSNPNFRSRLRSVLRNKALFFLGFLEVPPLSKLSKFTAKSIRLALAASAREHYIFKGKGPHDFPSKLIRYLIYSPLFFNYMIAILDGVKAHYFENPHRLSASHSA